MLNLLALFLPEEAVPIALVVAGIALIFGARRLAGTIALIAVLAAVLPFVVEPLIDALPPWLLVLLLVYLGLVVLQTLLVALFGGRAGNNAFGHVLGELVLRLLSLPFRTMRWSVHGLSWVLRRLM